AVDGLVHGFAWFRIVPGTFPLANIFKDGAGGNMCIMHRCGAGCFEELATPTTGQGGESDGSKRRTEGRGANFLGIVDPQDRSHDADGWHTGGLALVSTGRDRSVTFDVFHRAHARAGGAQHIGDRLVTLQINVVVVVMFDFSAIRRRYQPQRFHRAVWAIDSAGSLSLRWE